MKCINGIIIAVGVAVVAVLSGCDGGDNGKAATQVVAKVNDDEITVHQLNFELGRQQAAQQGNVEEASKVVLDQLINQQLLVQKATENKLDRNPQVLQSIERAKRLVLAQAYAQRLFDSSIPPTKTSIAQYYDEHPELFAERRVYQFQEVLVSKEFPAEELKAELEQADSLKAFVEKLQAKDVPMRLATSVKPAEQLPLEVLNKVVPLEQGQITTFASPQGVLILHLAGAREAPYTLEQATPMIERYLVAQQRKETINKEVERLRSAANIEYTGMFAGTVDETAPILAVPEDVSGEGVDNEDFLSKGIGDMK